jgi:carbonic anhydrase
LKEGNARFVAGHARFPTVQKEVLADLAKGQHPFATILGCSDSRVPPELVFDASFGELFVIRVAGNVLGPAIAGTLQYAGVHLHTPLLIVLGHQGCGAVEAAIAEKFHGARHRSRITLLLADIIPALETLDPNCLPRSTRCGYRGKRALDAQANYRITRMAGGGKRRYEGAGRRLRA